VFKIIGIEADSKPGSLSVEVRRLGGVLRYLSTVGLIVKEMHNINAQVHGLIKHFCCLKS